MKKFPKLITAYFIIGALALNAFLILKNNMPDPFNILPLEAWEITKIHFSSPDFYLRLLFWPYVLVKFLVDLILGKTG